MKFTPAPVDTKLELGSESRIHCNAEGQDPPITSWNRRGESSPGEGVFDVNGVLLFEKVRYDHAGLYMCTASSHQGSINKTILVEVVGEWADAGGVDECARIAPDAV